MSALELGFWSFPVLLAMIFLRAPIGLAMFVAGLGGLWLVTGSPNMALNLLKAESYGTFSSYSLTIIPMFLLMGQFATLSGMSSALFKAAEGWLGHRKGGVAMASVGACAGFGAICGSSLATAATMSRVALPELRRYGYSGGFSTATLAAGGTLGILIPPSVILVIYAILTEQNIASLFLAAFVPGILAAIGYMITISVYVRLNPESAGVKERVPYAERLRALAEIWPVILVFGLVVGGIYAGWFTPTEGAAVGAAGTGLLALLRGNMTWALFRESVITTAVSSAMIFFIILGAKLYNSFLALTQMPQELSLWVVSQGYAPLTVLILILVFYLVMGCLMDSLSMILLTIPIFWPVMQVMDFGLISLIDMQAARLAEGIAQGIAMAPDLLAEAQAKLAEGIALTREEFRALGLRPVTEAMHRDFNQTLTAIWFGILVLIVVEVGLITPPVGMNLFIINAMDRETPMSATYRSVLWFVTSDILRVALLVAFPSISVFLLM
ncbi:TRAP transporter large permease subunit [Rhodobacterales bacterium HKCCSP123]|nr:TRAP transporter large permease subunit [Rhodobacterales bacterium HKCCSP123]